MEIFIDIILIISIVLFFVAITSYTIIILNHKKQEDKNQLLVNEEVINFAFHIESYLAYHNDDDTLTKKEILELLCEILHEEYKIKTLK